MLRWDVKGKIVHSSLHSAISCHKVLAEVTDSHRGSCQVPRLAFCSLVPDRLAAAWGRGSCRPPIRGQDWEVPWQALAISAGNHLHSMYWVVT